MLFSPLGLLGLLAIPAILAIHLLRRRHRSLPVTGLFLYGAGQRAFAPGGTPRPLRRSISLWCELLAALALTFWLCDPQLAHTTGSTHLVVVFDTRLRMQASDAGNAGSPTTSACGRAMGALHERLAQLRRGDVVTLIGSGAPPQLIAGPAARLDQAAAALRSVRAEAPYHELDAALLLAAEVVPSGPGVVRLVVSDRVPPGLPEDYGVLASGRAAASSGIAEARWLRDDRGAERIILRAYAYGATAELTVELAVLPAAAAGTAAIQSGLGPGMGAGPPFAAQALRIDADRVVVQEIPVPVLPDGQRVRVTLRPQVGAARDPLPQDDAITLLPPARRVLRVAVRRADGTAAHRVALDQLPPGLRALRQGLAAVSGIVLVHEQPDLVLREADVQELAAARMSSGSASAAPRVEPGWTCVLAPGAAAPVLGPFLGRSGHALLADLDATGAVWAGGATIAADADPAAILLASGRTLLLAEQRAGRDRRIVVHADVSRGTLVQQAAWPVLIANIVQARRALLPGSAEANLRLGQAGSVVAPEDCDRIAVQLCDGTSRRLACDPDGRAIIPGNLPAGEHRLVALPSTPASASASAATAAGWQGALAIHALDARLGDLRAAQTAVREPAVSYAAITGHDRPPLPGLIALLIACCAAGAAWAAHARQGR